MLRWYQYLVQFVVFELNRIIRAINVPRPAFLVPVAAPASETSSSSRTSASSEAVVGGLEGGASGMQGSAAAAEAGDSTYGSLEDVPQDLLLAGGAGGAGSGGGGDSSSASAAAGQAGGGVAGQQPLVQASFTTGGLVPQTRVVEMQRPSAALPQGGSTASGTGSRGARDAAGALIQRPLQAAAGSSGAGPGFPQASLDQLLDSAAAGGAGGAGGSGGSISSGGADGGGGVLVQSSGSESGDPQLLAGLG